MEAIVATAERHGVPHVTGATWTTDALYRETRGKVDARVAEGCLTVEMEAAAFFAVAAFRGVTFGQVLYAGDDLSGEAWDQRGWDEHTSGRETLFRIAAEAVLALPPTRCPRPDRSAGRGLGASDILRAMAHDVTIRERSYRVRRPLGVFALSVVTLGAYWLYWYYAVNDDVRMFLRNYSIRPLVSTLAIVGLFLAAPIAVLAVLTEVWWLLAVAVLLVLVAFVGFFHTGRRVVTAQEQAGVEPSSAGLALALYVFAGFFGGSYLQAGLNRAWTRAADEERAHQAASAAAPPEREPVKPFPRPGAEGRHEPRDARPTWARACRSSSSCPTGTRREAVGTFERWDAEAETYFVRRKDGTEIRVPARGVRHGKVIPDRPAAPTPG